MNNKYILFTLDTILNRQQNENYMVISNLINICCHRVTPLLRNLQLTGHLKDGDDFHSRSLPRETSWGSKYLKVFEELDVTPEDFLKLLENDDLKFHVVNTYL